MEFSKSGTFIEYPISFPLNIFCINISAENDFVQYPDALNYDSYDLYKIKISTNSAGGFSINVIGA